MLEWLAGLNIRWVLIIVGVLLTLRVLLRRGSSPGLFRRQVAEFAETFAVALVMVFLVLHRFVFQLFFIPSESMVPTLLVHDRILVNRFLYRFQPPQRKDIIVFRAPRKASPEPKDFVKRLIGLPGETVSVVPDRVLIDGRPLLAVLSEEEGDAASSEPALRVGPDSRLRVEDGRLLVDGECLLVVSPTGGARLEGSALYVDGSLVYTFGPEESPHPAALPSSLHADGKRTGVAFYRSGRAPLLVLRGERLDIEPGHVEINGKPLAEESYVAQTPRYRMKPTRLGKDEYFVLGDNRNYSLDSHRWGSLAGSAIVGKAWAMFWPLRRAGLVN